MLVRLFSGLIMKKFIKDHKNGIIITAAVVLPFGLVALGAWKAYELYKGKKYVDGLKMSNSSFDDFRGIPDFSPGDGEPGSQNQDNH